MALSVLAEENEKLNHKRPELQFVQRGWGRGAWHRVELAQCRGVGVTEERFKGVDPKVAQAKAGEREHPEKLETNII